MLEQHTAQPSCYKHEYKMAVVTKFKSRYGGTGPILADQNIQSEHASDDTDISRPFCYKKLRQKTLVFIFVNA